MVSSPSCTNVAVPPMDTLMFQLGTGGTLVKDGVGDVVVVYAHVMALPDHSNRPSAFHLKPSSENWAPAYCQVPSGSKMVQVCDGGWVSPVHSVEKACANGALAPVVFRSGRTETRGQPMESAKTSPPRSSSAPF